MLLLIPNRRVVCTSCEYCNLYQRNHCCLLSEPSLANITRATTIISVSITMITTITIMTITIVVTATTVGYRGYMYAQCHTNKPIYHIVKHLDKMLLSCRGMCVSM